MSSPQSNCGALKLSWHISNDSLRSYMIEADLLLCVLICLDVYIGLQYWKLVKNRQKIAKKSRKIPKNLNLFSWYCADTPHMTPRSYMMKNGVPVCVLICSKFEKSFDLFRCLCWSARPKLVKNLSFMTSLYNAKELTFVVF